MMSNYSNTTTTGTKLEENPIFRVRLVVACNNILQKLRLCIDQLQRLCHCTNSYPKILSQT